MANKQIKYDIGFKVDESGLQKLKSNLQSLSQYKIDDLLKVNTNATEQDLKDLQRSIQVIQQALNKSYNFKLDSTNVTQFQKELQSSGVSLSTLAQNLGKAGVQGQVAFRNMATELLTTNTRLKESHSLLDSMATTLGNTIKWSIASGAINSITGSIQQAWGFTKKLDSSLNDIRIVTGKSSDEMERFAKQANKAAKSLGSATTDYTNAALIYYQQGLKEDDVTARTDVTIKAANVTGQSAAEVSEQLTAVWNGYKVVAEEAELYVDKLAAVAASTAADLEELSTGMSKVASAAFTMGVDIDQLSAQLSTIVSVTKQDASVVGTALKTIYARMGDLKVSGIDEFGTSLGDVSGQLKQMGIDVLDQEGNLRDMGTVIEEVAGKWGVWTDAQRQAAAVAIAGKRQYNNLIALFDNWNMYESALVTSQASEGTLQKQQKVYMDSLEGHLNQLAVAGEKVYDALFNNEGIKDLIDSLTFAVDLFGDFTNAIGGGSQLLFNLGAIGVNVFKKQISGAIITAWNNATAWYHNTQDIASEMWTAAELSLSANEKEIPGLQTIVSLKEEELKYAKYMNAEDKQRFETNIQMVTEAKNRLAILKEEEKILKQQTEDVEETLAARSIVPTRQKRAEDNMTREEYERATPMQRKVFVAGKVGVDLDTEEGAAIAVNDIEKRQKLLKQQTVAGAPNDLLNILSDSDSTPEDKLHSSLDYIEDAKSFLKSDLIPTEDLEAMAAAYEKLKIAKKEFSNATKELAEAEKEYQKAKASGENVEKAEELVLEKKKNLTIASNKVKRNAKTVAEQHQMALVKENLELEKYKKIIKENPKLLQKNTQEQEKANKALQKSTNDYKKFAKETKSKAIVNNIMGITSGLTQMGSAVTQLLSIKDIFNNDDMSNGEKALALILNIGSALPMVTSGLGSVVQGFAAFGKAQNTATLLSKAFTAEQMQSLLLSNKNNNELVESQLINLGYATSEEIKQNGLEKTVKSLNKEQTAQLMANVMSKQGAKDNLLQATTEEVKGKAGEEAGNKLFLAGSKAQLGFWPLLVIGLAIAAVLTTIIALIAIFSNPTELEKTNKVLEKEKEDLAAINEEYKLMNEELQKVRDSFDALAEKQKVINDLTVGTEEWTKAVQENNQAVMDLISQYSELAGSVTVSDTGVMSITQEGQEKLEKNLNEKTQRAYANTLFQQAEVMKAQQKVDSLEAGKAISKSYLKSLGYSEEYAAQNANANINLSERLDINSLGAMLMESGGSKEAFKEAFLNSGMENALSDMGMSADAAAEAIWAEQDAIYENISSINNNSDAIKKLEAAYASSFFSEDVNRAEAKSTAAWDAMMGNTITQEANKLNYTADNTASGDADNETISGDVKKNYAASLGVSEDDLVIDEEGGRIKIKGADDSTYKSVDTAAEQAAQYAGAKVAADQAEEITKRVNKMYDAAEKAGNAGLANLVGGQKSITFDENETTVESMDRETLAASRKAIFDSLKEENPNLSNDDIAKQLGYANYGEYELAFEKTVKQAESTIKNIGAGNLNDTFDISNFSNATIAQAREISDAFETVFKSAGNQGAEALNQMLSNFSEDPKTQEKIASIASSIDWMDMNAANQFRAALEDAGIAVDEQSVYWTNIVNSMESAANVAGAVAYQYAKIRSQLAEIKSLTEDLETGEIISDEDYKNLIKYNSKLKNMFIQTADGYKFIGGSSKEIKGLASEGYDDLNKVKEKYQNLSISAENFKNKEFEVSNTSTTNIATAASIMGTAGWENLLASQGINAEAYQKAYETATTAGIQETDPEAYKKAVADLKAGISAINQAKNDYELGLFSEDQAIETWISYNASDWAKTKKLLEGQGYSSTDETYKKFETQYKNEFLQELGLSLDSSKVESLDINKLEEAAVAARKLELDYLKEINAEIEKNEVLMETAFGSGMTALLEKQIENQKDAYDVTVQNAEWAKTVLNTALEGAGFEEEITLTELLNARAAIEDPESEEAKNLDSLIEKWNNAEDAANAVVEASQTVIDAQIQAYEYQLEMQNKITESLRRIRNLSFEFEGFEENGLSIFEKKNATDTVKDSLIKLEDNGVDLGKSFENLKRYSNISEVDITAVEAAQKNKEKAQENFNFANTAYNIIEKNFSDTSFPFLNNVINSVRDGAKQILDSAENRLDAAENDLAYYDFFLDPKNNPYYDAESQTFDAKRFEEDFGQELDKAHETLSSMKEELQNLYDSYLQAQDEMLELYDKEIQKLSTINDIYSTMADLSAIVGKNTSQYYNSIATNLTSSYALAQQQYATAQAEYNKLFNADGSRKQDISQEMYDKVADNLAAAVSNLTDLAQQTLEAVANSFSAQIKETIDAAIKATHDLDLAAASESWELAKSANEGYLDEVNARYGIDQLNRKIQTSIDDTDNYTAQKKLADLRAKQEQRLNDILEERGKLSQYELDRANAEYELTLKQIALEEAQQTANKMKLTRDASGNYTYQYVADQDAIAKAEEELAAAENNLYNIDKERNQSLVDEYYATMTEANEAIAEAMAQGDTERVERLREHYFGENGMIAGIQSELKASSGFLKEIGALVTGESFNNNITQVADQIASMKLSGDDGLFANINKLIGAEGIGIKALSDATGTISSLLQDNGILQTVVNSVSNTQKNADILNSEVTELSNATSSIINKLPSLVTNVKALADQLDLYANNYNDWLDKQVNSTEVEANTEALGNLTRSIIELKDTLDNGKIDGSLNISGWNFGDDGVWTQNANNDTD